MCRFLGLEHDVYDLVLRNLVERIVQYVEDKADDFNFKEFLEKILSTIEAIRSA
jgi:hypothetical protein